MRRDRVMTEVLEQRAPTREGVLRAAGKVAALLPPTPLIRFEIGGATVWAKAECLQPLQRPVGRFWVRVHLLGEFAHCHGYLSVVLAVVSALNPGVGVAGVGAERLPSR